jgi:hypothetical protein
MRESYSHVFRNRLKCHLFQSNRYGIRNRLKCHLLQSIILSLSLITVNLWRVSVLRNTGFLYGKVSIWLSEILQKSSPNAFDPLNNFPRITRFRQPPVDFVLCMTGLTVSLVHSSLVQHQHVWSGGQLYLCNTRNFFINYEQQINRELQGISRCGLVFVH